MSINALSVFGRLEWVAEKFSVFLRFSDPAGACSGLVARAFVAGGWTSVCRRGGGMVDQAGENSMAPAGWFPVVWPRGEPRAVRKICEIRRLHGARCRAGAVEGGEQGLRDRCLGMRA